MTAFEDFVNLELPRRSAFLNLLVTGFDGDPNDGGAPAIISGAPLGTWFREDTAGKWWRKTETVWEDQGLGSSSASGCLIYEPGGASTGPIIFNDWDELVIRLITLRAAADGSLCDFILAFSDRALPSSFDPIIIPNGPVDDMDGVRWDGSPSEGGANVHISDGKSFTNWRSFRKIFLRNLNTTNPADNSLAGGATIDIDGSDITGNAGTGIPLYGGVGAGDFVLCRMSGGATLGNNSDGRIFDAPAGGFLIMFYEDAISRIQQSRTQVLAGAVGSFLVERAPGQNKYLRDHPDFLGTIFDRFPDNPASLVTKPQGAPASTSSLAADFGQHLRFDASGGDIAQTLPDISSENTLQAGTFLTVVEVGGGQVTLNAAAGDTIRGLASVLVPPGGGLILQSDGVSNWDIVGEFAASRACLRFRPGGPVNGPTVFNDLDSLYAVVDAMRAVADEQICVTVFMDASLEDPIQLDTGNSYDSRGVTFEAADDSGLIDVRNDTQFPGLLKYRGVTIRTFNATEPVVELEHSQTVEMISFAGISGSVGSPAFFSGANLVAGENAALTMELLATIANNSDGPVFDFPVAGTNFFVLSGGGRLPNLTRPGAFVGAIGTTMILFAEHVNQPVEFPDWDGTIITLLERRAGLLANPYLLPPATASVSNALGDAILLDATAGQITQPLAAISGDAFALRLPGGFQTIKETSGINGVLLTAAGGDTIEGNATFFIPPGCGVVLQIDGLSRWNVVGFRSPLETIFVYQPGGTGIGPVLFSDWQTLENAKEAARAAAGGEFAATLRIDDTIVSPAVIPANGANPDYNFFGVTPEGINTGFNSRLDFADGASIVGLRTIGANLGIRSLTSGSLEDVGPMPGGAIIIELGLNSFINQANGGRFFDTTSSTPGDFLLFFLRDSANLNFNFGGGSGTDDVIFLGHAGGFALIVALSGSFLPFNGYGGIVGTTMFLRASTMLAVPRITSPSFLGTIVNVDEPDTPPSWGPNPLFAAPHTTLQAGTKDAKWTRYDVSGGPVAHVLAQIIGGNIFKRQGIPQIIAEESGSVGLTVEAPAGMTLNGGTVPIAVPPGGAFFIVNDGDFAWRIIASHDPTTLSLASNSLIFREGAPDTGPVVFGVFDDLMARLASLQVLGGTFEVVLDDSVTSPIVVPANPDTTPIAAASAFAGPTGLLSDRMTVDTGVALTADDIGRWLTIVGAPTAANDGTFLITATPGGGVAEYLNAAGVAEASAPATVALTVPHDFTNTSLSAAATNSPTVNLADRITFKGLRHVKGDLFLTCLTVAGGPSAVSDFGASGGTEAFTFGHGANVNGQAAGPAFIDTTAGGAIAFFLLNLDSRASLSQNGGITFHAGLAGQFIFTRAGRHAAVWTSSFSGVVGSILRLQTAMGGSVSPQPFFLGTLQKELDNRGPLQVVTPFGDLPASTVPLTNFSTMQVVRLDVSGGGFTQVLPRLPSENTSRIDGRRVTVKEESGTAGLFVQGNTGGAPDDTIEGSLDLFPVPAGGTVIFVNDGESNWFIESIFDPAVSGSELALASNALVFLDGDAANGPTTFGVWADLTARLALLRDASGGKGRFTVAIDGNSVANPIIPALPNTTPVAPTGAFTFAADVLTIEITAHGFVSGDFLGGPNDVGRWANIVAATSGGNNGNFLIVGIPDADHIEVRNDLGVAEAAGAAMVSLTVPHDLRNADIELVNFAIVDIADGATIKGVRSFKGGRSQLGSDALVGSPSPFTDFGNETLIFLNVTEGVSFRVASFGGPPMFDFGAADSSLFLTMGLEASTLGNGGGPIFHLGKAGQFGSLSPRGDGFFYGSTLSTVLGALFQVNIPQGHLFQPIQTFAVPGTVASFILNVGPQQVVRPSGDLVPATAPLSTFPTAPTVFRFDVSGGPVAQPLPLAAVSGSTTGTGHRLTFTETSGSVGLTAVPSGADTIDGSTDPYPIPPGGTVVLINDGISNFIVENVHDTEVTKALASNSLIFKDTAPDTGPVVFGDFFDLMTKLDSLRGDGGSFDVIVSDELVARPSIPGNPDTTPIAAASAFAGPTGPLSDRMTVDTGVTLTADDIGRWIKVAGAPTSDNDGAFLITATPGGGVAEYLNPLGVAEASSPATIALTVPHNFENTSISSERIEYDIEENCTFKGLKRFKGAGFVYFQGSTGTPAAISDFDPTQQFRQFEADEGVVLNGIGGAPLVDTTAGHSALRLNARVASTAVFNGPVFHVGLAGQRITILNGTQGTIRGNTLSTVVGTLNFIFCSPETSVSLQGLAVAGTVEIGLLNSGLTQNVTPTPDLAASTVPVAPNTQTNVVRCNVSGGGFTQLLPDLPTDNGALITGRRVTVIETSGSAGLLVDGAGANTVDGAGPFTMPAGATVVFVAESDTNWSVESIKDPGKASRVTSIKVAAYNAVSGDFIRYDPSGGAFAIALPDIDVVGDGAEIEFKNTTTNATAMTITTDGAETIDGAATLVLTGSREYIKLKAAGTDWMILS